MSNTITQVLPKLLAQGLKALRQSAVMPQLVNRDYEGLAAQKGNVINIPIPSAITARSVTPDVVFASAPAIAPAIALVTLDQWYEAPFSLSDNDMVSVMNGTIPMQASEAIKALANNVDTYIMGKSKALFGNTGSAGTTPFNGSLTGAATAKKLLSQQLAPTDYRRAVIDPSAEANLLINSAVLNPFSPNERVTDAGIIQGTIGTKLGFDWYMDQNVSTFTPGTGWVTGWAASTVAGSIGDTTLNILNATASGTIIVGDIFSVGGYSYVITAAANASATVQVAVAFYPALKSAVATGAAITVIGTAYTQNLAFHRDCFAFASRPLADIQGLGHEMVQATDPVSGISLRLEVSRQYKQTTFSYDILYGANVVRPELGVKILG